MPLIDPGLVATSPFLADSFWITRRPQVVGSNGRAQVVNGTPSRAYGIVTVAGPQDLQRLPEQQFAGNVMTFISRRAMLGPTPGYQPDLLSWAGTDYVVLAVWPYPRYGSGWYIALASSMNPVDVPPDLRRDVGGVDVLPEEDPS